MTTLYADDEATLMRYRFAPDASFDKAAAWLYDGMGAAFKSGAARLAIAGANPSLLSNEDPDKVGRANRAVSAAYRPALELITRHAINWTIVASATPAWAAAMFPNDAPDAAMAKLWDAIFETTRINVDDPVAAWKTHDAASAQSAPRVSTKNAMRRCAIAAREPIFGSALPTIISGSAAERRRATATTASPTCPRKKSSPRRTKTAPMAPSLRPSRCRTRAR